MICSVAPKCFGHLEAWKFQYPGYHRLESVEKGCACIDLYIYMIPSKKNSKKLKIKLKKGLQVQELDRRKPS